MRCIANRKPNRLLVPWRLTIFGALLVLLGASAGFGADIVVDTIDDVAADDGLCSFREAVSAANGNFEVDTCAAGDGWDRVLFVVPGTIVLTGQRAIFEDLTIIGLGAEQTVLDADDEYRHFRMIFDSRLVLAGITLRGGWAEEQPGTATEDNGGAIYLNVGGSVTVIECVFEDNHAANGGGAIFFPNDFSGTDTAYLVVIRSEFRSNTAAGPTGGGAIRIGNNHFVTLIDTTLQGNSAFHENGDGGGLRAQGATVSIVRSTISGNNASRTGGISASQTSDVEIHDSAIVGNTSTPGSNAAGLSLSSPSSTLVIKNSIVAGNLTDGVESRQIHLEPGLGFTTLGTNFLSTNLGITSLFPQGEPNRNLDFVGEEVFLLDPDLGSLRNYGGPTSTRVPNTNSPVIDLGLCAAEQRDQRGFEGTDGRIVGSQCDIGPVEFGAVDPLPIFRSDFEVGATHLWSSEL